MPRTLAEHIARGRLAITLARRRGIDTSEWEQCLADLLAQAGAESSQEDSFTPGTLREWRRVSIPDWRRILAEARQHHDARREEYARWMLREVLLDPSYEEGLGR